MVLEPGDKITGQSGEEYEVGELIAIGCEEADRRFDGVDHSHCTVRGRDEDDNYVYMGHHCPHCGTATSYQGHGMTGRFDENFRNWRDFADGKMHFPCQEDLKSLPVEELD